MNEFCCIFQKMDSGLVLLETRQGQFNILKIALPLNWYLTLSISAIFIKRANVQTMNDIYTLCHRVESQLKNIWKWKLLTVLHETKVHMKDWMLGNLDSTMTYSSF